MIKRFSVLYVGQIGFENVGAKCVFTSEWDEPCQATYEANFGERPAGDITTIASADIPDHDILTGGFPCQPFSIIGDRHGFADTRGTLFFEVERILKDKQPYAFCLENVRQLVSHDQGRTFKVMLQSLEKLGYYVHWSILKGLDFGVPQKRDRVIIVGFKQNHPFQFPTGPIRKPVTLSDILEPEHQIDPKHFLSPHMKQKLAKRVKNKHIPTPSVWHENKSGNVGVHPFSCALRANASHSYLVVNGERRLTPREMLRLQGFPDTFQPVGSDSQVKKQAGNAVVVPKFEAVAKAMVDALNTPPVKLLKQTTVFQKSTAHEPLPQAA